MMIRHSLFFISVFFVTAQVQAQIIQTCSVLDNSGTSVTGGVYSGLTAGGQPGTINTSSDGQFTLYSGFLSCVVLAPNLDTDGDGVSNEIDSDNDNDGLSDLSESTGNAFNPPTITQLNVTDSDGDGSSDGAESVAMTNPMDDTSTLRFISIVDQGTNQVNLAWQARSGLTYGVYARSSADEALPGTLIGKVIATGGIAPWFETTATANDSGLASTDRRVYHIELSP